MTKKPQYGPRISDCNEAMKTLAAAMAELEGCESLFLQGDGTGLVLHGRKPDGTLFLGYGADMAQAINDYVKSSDNDQEN